MTSTRPSEQRQAELAQQLAQGEAAGWRASRSRSTSARSRTGRQLRHLGEQLRRRRQAFAHRAAAHAARFAEPAAEVRRAEALARPSQRGGGRRAGERRVAGRRRPVAVPRRRPRSSSALGPGAQRVDAALDRLGDVLVQPGQQAPVDGGPRGQLLVGPLSMIRPSSRTTTRSARWSVERRWATSSVVRPGEHRAQALVDRLLGARVDGAGRVVEDQDRAGPAAPPAPARSAAAARRRGSARARRRRCRSRAAGH